MSNFNEINSRYRGFQLTKIVPLEELNCTLRELVHIHSQAKVLHIENDDPENVFCLSFQTLPSSSDGVAHILEHTVLCGSKKFPIKDPFFSMNRRSLNTFMNALTGSDFTCYPAASQIPQDFYNLLDVYLDAVFYPHLKEMSFQQEGHRLEFETPDDLTTPLKIKGIVYNEMKGAMHSGSARMHEALYHALFPDITYGVNSGGDPAQIPDLTYDALLQFHNTYYHPSRCLFFFYGNFPLAKHLDFLEEQLLLNVEKKPELPPIPLQPRFSAPKHLQKKYPASPHEALEDKALISFGWLTCHILEQETCLALSILEIVLLDTDASPLKKALLQSTLCTQVSSYVDTQIHEVPFTIHLKGCKPESGDALETLIRETLKSLIENGIPYEAIENAIHQLEFHRSEITGDDCPFGLTLFMRSGLLSQHGGLPENGLLIHTLFSNIRRQHLQNPHFFTDLIAKYLLNNPHFVRVILIPDSHLAEEESQEEQMRLEKILSSLSLEDKEKIVLNAAKLKKFQQDQERETRDILPKVTLADVPKSTHSIPLSREVFEKLEIVHHSCFTNEIGYVDLFFDLPPLTPNELMMTRWMTTLLYQIGCHGRSYEDTLAEIQAHTGGIIPYLTLHIQANDYNSFFPAFALRGKALHHKMANLLPLLCDMILTPDLQDTKRIKEIVLKHFTLLESGLNHNALKYAINLSASSLSLPSYIANLWYGLEYFQLIRNLAKDFDASHEEFLNRLSLLKDKILNSAPSAVLSCDKEEYAELKLNRFFGLTQLSNQSQIPWTFHAELPFIEPQGRIITSPVAFIAKVFSTIPYNHPKAAALNLAAFLFNNLILHRKIREEGGAYGGGAVNNALGGNFYFYSYRDPHIASSLLAFEEAIQTVQKGHFDNQDLEEAKLEMVQQLDTPVAPGSRAVVAFHWLKEGRSEEIRQTFRDRLLAMTCEDVSQAVTDYIAPQFALANPVVFASETHLIKENDYLIESGQKPLIIKDVY